MIFIKPTISRHSTPRHFAARHTTISDRLILRFSLQFGAIKHIDALRLRISTAAEIYFLSKAPIRLMNCFVNRARPLKKGFLRKLYLATARLEEFVLKRA